MTKIQEKEFEKKIVVSGQNFSCDDVDTEIDQQFSRRAEEARTALNNNRIPDHLR